MPRNYAEPEPLALSPEKIAEIKTELDLIENSLMPSIRKRLAVAYEDGDMPENNPWLTANDELQSSMKRRNELRLLLLRAKRHHATAALRIKTSTISIGSTVSLSLNSSPKQTITLVASEEADPENNKISVDSPLGKALCTTLDNAFDLLTPGGTLRVIWDLE